ncbi:MAG TPA: diaminopimelate decarboxylase [Gemmatimonadales bacterium]|nr:diaminopimelate decarboxylase [Gemmatimonadales bacterium]
MGKSVLTAGVEPTSGALSDLGPLFGDAGLVRSGADLEMGGVPLATIAEKVGTPLYVYNAAVIRDRYQALETAFAEVPHKICYAIKANSNLAVLRVLRDLGAGADIVSGGEMRRALKAGFPPERIVFSGVGKTGAELETAVAARLGHVHLESVAEMKELAEIAQARGARVRVGIRVNPDVTAKTHPFIATGQGAVKFGVPYDQVVDLAVAIAQQASLKLDTIAMHLGSQLLDPAPYRQGLERLLAVVDRIAAAGIDTLRYLDIGGGLGIRYRDEVALEPAQVAEAVVPLLKGRELTIVLEPGRFLVGSSGVLLTQVLSRKHSGGKDLVIVDAGMNDLVRPSHYGAFHAITELNARGRAPLRMDVVGPVCETGDFLALDRELPGLERGDLLAVLGAGAYGFVMSSTYNTRPRPAEVMVDAGRWAVVRPRIRDDEIFAAESVEPDWETQG